MNQAQASESHWVLDASAVEELLRELDFRAEIIDYLGHAAREFAQTENAPQFLELCRLWRENPRQYSGDTVPSSWKVLAAVSTFPATLQKNRARGVPEAISKATFLDLQRRMEYSGETKSWHFDKLAWLQKHVNGEFFEIGRLQYHLGTFGYLVRVYRDSATDDIVPLALSGRRCTAEGWPRDDATDFETQFEERSDGIYGHPVSPEDGSIARTLKRVPPDSPVLLDDQSRIAQIHIPTGQKLEREACCASLRAAKAFFGQCFPEIKLRGFCTATWLLDRELGKVLPADSNIVAFGRLFRPLPLNNGNDHQLLERAFGPDATWETCEAVTSLQKSVLQHHRSGRQFRTTAGFILSEDIEVGTQSRATNPKRERSNCFTTRSHAG